MEKRLEICHMLAMILSYGKGLGPSMDGKSPRLS